MERLRVGDVVEAGLLATAAGERARVPDLGHLTHLQFRRFAGCPFCSLHLRAFARRHAEILAAGIREVVVFRATAAALRRHHGGLPFPMVPDAQGALYAKFGVGSGPRAVLNPRVLLGAAPAMVAMLPKLPGLPRSGKGALGFPADFLIAADGRILACKYGRHADDQWSVDELLTLASQPGHESGREGG